VLPPPQPLISSMELLMVNGAERYGEFIGLEVRANEDSSR
jgi:hypothetical protein